MMKVALIAGIVCTGFFATACGLDFSRSSIQLRAFVSSSNALVSVNSFSGNGYRLLTENAATDNGVIQNRAPAQLVLENVTLVLSLEPLEQRLLALNPPGFQYRGNEISVGETFSLPVQIWKSSSIVAETSMTLRVNAFKQPGKIRQYETEMCGGGRGLTEPGSGPILEGVLELQQSVGEELVFFQGSFEIHIVEFISISSLGC
jgi:hypothetical protein